MSRRAPFPFPPPGVQNARALERLLYVDLAATARGFSRNEQGSITSVALAALTVEVLISARPDRVICSLFGARQDAFAVIERLQALGFGGAITVLSPRLPRPLLVEAELRALGPGHRLTLLQIS
jgi:hypothetical protein